MAYATYSDVQARVPYRTIGAATKPTDTQVTAWITESEAMLNGVLAAADLPAPYSSTAAVNILKSWVCDRAEGLVRQAYASAGGDGTNEDGKDLVLKFDKLLEDILKRPAIYGAMLAGGDAPATSVKVRAYVTDNADGLSISNGDFAPTFTRDEVF